MHDRGTGPWLAYLLHGQLYDTRERDGAGKHEAGKRREGSYEVWLMASGLPPSSWRYNTPHIGLRWLLLARDGCGQADVMCFAVAALSEGGGPVGRGGANGDVLIEASRGMAVMGGQTGCLGCGSTWHRSACEEKGTRSW